MSSSPQVRQSADERLMCSTCDKVFVARSILERHLKTSGHGGSDNWDLKPQAPGPGMNFKWHFEFFIRLLNHKTGWAVASWTYLSY